MFLKRTYLKISEGPPLCIKELANILEQYVWKKGLCMVLMHGTACLQDMGMGGQVYDRQQIEQMYGKGGENFPGQLPAVLRSMLSIAFGGVGQTVTLSSARHAVFCEDCRLPPASPRKLATTAGAGGLAILSPCAGLHLSGKRIA